jgi:flagellar FliJ protein
VRRFRFDLEKVLELRAFHEREAELELGRAMGELAVIEQKIRNIAAERVAIAAERFAGGRSAAEIRNSELYLIRLDHTRDALLEAAAKAELVVETKREAFKEASRERKVMDKLKDKRKSEYRKEALLDEIKTLDDLSGGTASRHAVSGDGTNVRV